MDLIYLKFRSIFFRSNREIFHFLLILNIILLQEYGNRCIVFLISKLDYNRKLITKLR